MFIHKINLHFQVPFSRFNLVRLHEGEATRALYPLLWLVVFELKEDGRPAWDLLEGALDLYLVIEYNVGGLSLAGHGSCLSSLKIFP